MQDLAMLAAAMLATGCVAGILAGLFGIGGGIIIVPVLEAMLAALGVDSAIRMHVAVGTSLATIIPTSIASARAHHRRGSVNVDVLKRWWFYLLAGTLLGTWIAAQVHSRVLALVFATFAMLAAIKLAFSPQTRNITAAIPTAPWVGVIPTAIGCASAMMGIGGGTFSVTVLTLFNEAIHRAVGTAALFGLVISLPGTLGFVLSGWGNAALPPGSLGFVSLIGFALIAPATVLFAPLGARIAHAFTERVLSRLFGLFLIAASLRLAYRALA